jgi:hypothetical protein
MLLPLALMPSSDTAADEVMVAVRARMFDLCVCVHGADWKTPFVKALMWRDGIPAARPRVKVLDMRDGIAAFVAELLKCRGVVSSSLHGVIIAGTPHASRVGRVGIRAGGVAV